jgi:BrnA antitoxin of type II toxin-antitoxin system
MNEWMPASSFNQAAEPDEKLAIDPAILAWFKARGTGWQDEINGVLCPASAPVRQLFWRLEEGRISGSS